MLISSSGPQTPMRRAVAVAFVVSLAAMALVWLLSWPTRSQSQMFSITGALGIAAICVIESDPRSGMLGCAAFGGLAGTWGFFIPLPCWFFPWAPLYPGYTAVLC